jgi:hypothetical protein
MDTDGYHHPVKKPVNQRRTFKGHNAFGITNAIVPLNNDKFDE